MSAIAGLHNHIVRIYREPTAVSARNTQGHVSASPASIGAAPTVVNSRPDQSWVGAQGGLRRWFIDKGVAVLKRDVLSVIAGPETGLKLRVENVIPIHGRVALHHYEVTTSVFNGVLA